MAFTRATTFPALYGGPGPASAPLGESGSVTDTLSVAVTDSSSLLMSVAISVSDTVSVSISDASSLVATDVNLYRTQPGLYGGPVPYVVISDKSVTTTFSLNVSDTLNVQWTEDPVDSNEIVSGDNARISLSEVSSLLNYIQTSDNVQVQISETISLLQSGVTLKSTSDTLSVTLTDVSDIRVTVAVTDTTSVSVTDTSSLLTPTAFVSVTDSLSVSVSEDRLLGVFTGILDIVVSDNLMVSLSELGQQADYVTPPVVMPFRIRIIPRIARIRIVSQ